MNSMRSFSRRAEAVASAAVATLRPRRGKRIVLMHEVTDSARLRQKLSWLLEHFEVLSLAECLDRPQGPTTQIAVTFDDGYRSWYDQALPVLTELSVPAVFFVCSGFIGLRGAAAGAFCVRHFRRTQQLDALDVQQLRALAEHPLFEIGSHTVNSVDLGGVSEPAVLASEIGGDRQRLEEWTGRRVRWFAYPFGQPENTSPAARSYLRAQGFAGAFTLVPGFAAGADRFAVGRDSLEITDPIWVWQARLAGGDDGLYRMKRRLRGLPGA